MKDDWQKDLEWKKDKGFLICIAKEKTEELKASRIRKKLTKLVLFSGQHIFFIFTGYERILLIAAKLVGGGGWSLVGVCYRVFIYLSHSCFSLV